MIIFQKEVRPGKIRTPKNSTCQKRNFRKTARTLHVCYDLHPCAQILHLEFHNLTPAESTPRKSKISVLVLRSGRAVFSESVTLAFSRFWV